MSWKLCALALIVFSPLHLAYSQELRPYAFGIFIALAGWWNVQYLVRSAISGMGRRGGLPLQVFLWTCLLYTHYWGAFVGLAQGVYGLVAAQSRDQRRQIVIAGLVSVALFAVWAPVFWRASSLHDWRVVFGCRPRSLALNWGKPSWPTRAFAFKIASSAFKTPGADSTFDCFWRGLQMALAIWGLQKAPRFALYWLGIGVGLPWLLSYSLSSSPYVRLPLSGVYAGPAFLIVLAAGVGPGALAGGRQRYFSGSLDRHAGRSAYGVIFPAGRKPIRKPWSLLLIPYASLHPLVVRPAYFSFLSFITTMTRRAFPRSTRTRWTVWRNARRCAAT